MSDRSVPAGLRVAGIGAGYFSRFHYEAWQRIERVELVAVADLDITKAADVGTEAFDDAQKMLETHRPDVVDIITPPPTHLDMIRLGLASGAKAIICQKPFCGNLASAEQASALAAEAGVHLVVHENFRFQPWYRRVRAEIAAGRIGRLLQLTFRLRPGDGQGPDAYLNRQPYFQKMPRFLIHETGIHWIDTFRFLMGEPAAVYAELRQLNPAIAGEDAGYFIYSYADGARALFDGNRLLDHAASDNRLTMGECRVEGTQGELQVSGDGSLRWRARGAIDWESLCEPPADRDFGGGCVAALQRHVVEALLDGQPLENQAASYLANMRIECALYESAASRRKVELEP